MEVKEFCQGRWGSVVYATALNGSRPAEEFLAGLDRDQLTKASALFRWFADHGEIRNREKFKKVRGEIFEFKSYQVRVLCFFDSKKLVLTNGCIKKRDTLDESDIARSERIRSEHRQQTSPKLPKDTSPAKPRKR